MQPRCLATFIANGLQAQTNSLATGLGTNWVTISGTENSNSFNVTLNPTSASVFYRMVYP